MPHLLIPMDPKRCYACKAISDFRRAHPTIRIPYRTSIVCFYHPGHGTTKSIVERHAIHWPYGQEMLFRIEDHKLEKADDDDIPQQRFGPKSRNVPKRVPGVHDTPSGPTSQAKPKTVRKRR